MRRRTWAADVAIASQPPHLCGAVGLTGPTRRAARRRPKNGGARILGLNVGSTGATGGKTLRLLDSREQLQASALAASSEGTAFDFWGLFGNRATEPSGYNGRLYPTS